MDYEFLDKILTYLKEARGYESGKNYLSYIGGRNNFIMEALYSESYFAGCCNLLNQWGLVDYKYNDNDGHIFSINPKGIDLVNSGKSTRDIHEEYKRREKLEDRILQGTIESHQIGKRATNLNIIQLVVTGILGIVTFFSLYYQNQANNIATKSLEIAEKAHQLELDNKKTIDSVVVIMSTHNQVKQKNR